MRVPYSSLLLLGGCKAAGRCALFVLEAFDSDSQWDEYEEAQKRQAEIQHFQQQIVDEAMRD